MTVLFLIIILALYIYEKKQKKEIGNCTVPSIMPQTAVCNIQNQSVPVFRYPLVNYEVGEKCHYVENAVYFAVSHTTYRQRTSTGTAAAKKNRRNWTCASTTYPITTSSTNKYEGRLIITNRRILFLCDQYDLYIPLTSIIAYTPYRNRIVIHTNKSIHCIYVPNGYVVANLLYAINQNTYE